MTRRPDVFDRAEQQRRLRRAAARHLDGAPSVPSPGWRRPNWWPATWGDIRLLWAQLTHPEDTTMPESSGHHHDTDRGRRPVSHRELNERLSHYVRHGDLLRHLRDIGAQLGRIEKNTQQIGMTTMATQADVDAVAAELHEEGSTLNTAVGNIQTKLADLETQVANGQPVDLSGLRAEVDALGSAVQNAASLVPPPADSGSGDSGSGSGDTPPADGGDGSAPVDSGDGSAPVDGSGDAPSA